MIRVKYFSRRRFWLVPVTVWVVLMVVACCWLEETSRALAPPPPPGQDLEHFKRSTILQYYLDHIQLLIEPSSACEEDLPVVILVSSAPSHVEHRDVIRSTWGRHQPTYFVVGLQAPQIDDTLVDNYLEAKQHSDLIVFDMVDHYQNLTLKTVLMLQWTLQRCPRAQYLFKTDDDVLVNPWALKTVLDEHPEVKLLGYRKTEGKLHRDQYTKWFVPRWLRREDDVPEYLSGTGYLINGNSLQKILAAAKKVPLMNLEDVYLTYLVAKRSLNIDLVHDWRLSPYKPWLPSDCAYWSLASSHSYSPEEIAHAWDRIESVAKESENASGVCEFYKGVVENEIFLS